jgi:adenosylmethionine-8-amino-7-oxononanoate aminotransferase
MIDSLAMTASTHVFHRSLRQTPAVAVGAGLMLRDAQGRQYLDASGGAAVSCLGHGHPEVRAAMHAQIDQLAYAHTSFFTTEVAEVLADELVAHAPSGMSRAYFVSGGSEAVEAALKLARQYFLEIGQPERTHFIARRQSYHGNTLGALAVGGNEWRRRQFAPLLIDVAHVAPCYPYRDQREDETPEQYGQRLARELEQAIERLGSNRVIAFVAETVGGATAGVLAPVPGYFKAVREVCDRHGVLLILDEVMCGMGRTGTLHACEQEEVTPDLMTIAKGLGGGYQPIGAVLAQGCIVEAIAKGSGFFQHGHTYLGHSVACAAALAVQRVIRRDGLLAKVEAEGRLSGRCCAMRWRSTGPWATSAGAASFGVSSWCVIVQAGSPSTRRFVCTPSSRAKPWRAACCATPWAARSMASGATTYCWRRPSLPPVPSCTRSPSA